MVFNYLSYATGMAMVKELVADGQYATAAFAGSDAVAAALSGFALKTLTWMVAVPTNAHCGMTNVADVVLALGVIAIPVVLPCEAVPVIVAPTEKVTGISPVATGTFPLSRTV